MNNWIKKASEIFLRLAAAGKRHLVLCLISGLAGLVLIIGFIPFSLPGFQRQVEEQAAKLTGGDTLRLEKLSFQLWKGVSLRGVYYATRAGQLPAIKLRVPRIRLSYRLLPLLRGKVALDKITLSSPAAELILPPPAATAAPAKPIFSSPLNLPLGKVPLDLPVDLEIKELTIRHASLTARQPPDLKITAAGLDLDLTASLGKTLTARGRLAIDSLWVPHPYLATGFKAGFYTAPGRLEVSDCGFSVYRGRGRVSATVDTAAVPLCRAEFELKDLQLARLLAAARFNRGQADGKVNLQLQVQGRTLNPGQWQGHGSFQAKKLDLSDLPFQKTLALLLLLPKLKHLQFDRVATSLKLSQGKIFTPDLQGTGNLVNFTGSGWVGLNLVAREKVQVSLSPELCSRLPAVVSREIMSSGRNGCCETGGELHGPLADLKIELDQRTKTRAAGVLIREAGSQLINILRRR